MGRRLQVNSSRHHNVGHNPPEVFMTLFKEAIDAAVHVLRESGFDEAETWNAYEQALSHLVDSTLNVDDEFGQRAA